MGAWFFGRTQTTPKQNQFHLWKHSKNITTYERRSLQFVPLTDKHSGGICHRITYIHSSVAYTTMTFIVYSKPGCSYCTKVKKVLELAEQSHVIYTLDREFSGSEFKDTFGHKATFPQVTVNDKHIGGCIETVKYLREKQLV